MSESRGAASVTLDTIIAKGQTWRDAYGNEFVVTGLRKVDRVSLRHLKYQNVRHVPITVLRSDWTLVSS